MTPEAVDKMLEHYRENKARCELLKKMIAELRDTAASARATMRADAANGVQVLTGMPHGSGVSNPTERCGMLFASGYVPEGIQEIEDEIARYENELRYKSIPVSFLESLLDGLTKKEYLIVYGKYIDGLTWRELADSHQKQFGVYISLDAMKRINKKAKQKLYQIAQ